MKPFRLTLAQILCRNLPPIMAQQARGLIYPQSVAVKDDFQFSVRSQTGSTLRQRTSDYHGYPFSVHGYYDWRRWAIARALCQPGDRIIEIGANVGTETVGFSDIVGQTGQVFAFEPFPANVASLRQVQNTTVFPLAVGDECKRLTFAIPTREASGIGYIKWSDNGDSDTIEIDCTTLDSIAGLSANMLFVDAEGAEVRILDGAEGLIRRDRPAIVLEASQDALVRAGDSLPALLGKIHDLGYEPFLISRLRLASINPARLPDGNWFCVHRSQLKVTRKVSRSILACALLPCLPWLNPLRG